MKKINAKFSNRQKAKANRDNNLRKIDGSEEAMDEAVARMRREHEAAERLERAQKILKSTRHR